jgi:tRNA-Thr(GGU) m(6)t(6)A37 methyltransferase TsaA
MSAEKQFFIEPIAYIKNGYNEKFGIPRQGGLVNTVESRVVMCDKYNDEVMFRGLEQYSHLWLIWNFSENSGEWYPTVRPPKLGGNKRMGVFATRSPFRPNNMGLSCVRLEKIEKTPEGIELVVLGADLKNGTPVFDIKPYLPYVDCIKDASGGFSDEHKDEFLKVEISPHIEIDDDFKNEITGILSLDPRPQYQDDENRVYGMSYKDKEIKFLCKNNVICVQEITGVKK